MDELYKFWFDNFTPKKWSHTRHVMNSGQKLVGNLGRSQIWPMWLCKGYKITLLKVGDETNYFTKFEGRFEWFSPMNNPILN